MARERFRWLAAWAIGLAASACTPGSEESPQDVARDRADVREAEAEADAGPCGPGGECEDASLTCCPSGCQDLENDFLNCGECGYDCPVDQECQRGRCYTPECNPECLPGQMCCDGDCVDPTSDDLNCGRCGHDCEPPLGCVGGACMCGSGTAGEPCEPGETCCPDGCKDVLNDPENCGECGATCRGFPCNSGQCRCGDSVCPVGQACCDEELSLCADLTRDMDHCGDCDHRCDPLRSEACVDGTCLCGAEEACTSGTVTYPLCQISPFMPPYRCCAGSCERVDDSSCARCGVPCGAGLECQATPSWLGYCEFVCGTPEE